MIVGGRTSSWDEAIRIVADGGAAMTARRRLAARRHVAARAWPVRSQARLFGARVPMRGWTDHDWVLVVARDGHRWYVDPTLDDTGLGWDVTSNVRGTVSPPR